jgi:hypothetical protein
MPFQMRKHPIPTFILETHDGSFKKTPIVHALTL